MIRVKMSFDFPLLNDETTSIRNWEKESSDKDEV